MKFNAAIARSSWVALRILPSAHTHPVFVQVAGKKIRASKHSAQWCRTCVDKLWDVKSPLMRDSEVPEAAQAYDHARSAYHRSMHTPAPRHPNSPPSIQSNGQSNTIKTIKTGTLTIIVIKFALGFPNSISSTE